jgi:hypothetical protein
VGFWGLLPCCRVRTRFRAPMSLDEFRTLVDSRPPPGMSGALAALLYAAASNWDAAHDAAQGDETPAGAWVHAYIHRKEGDLGNAGYWYRRAGRPVAKGELAVEWEQIAGVLLDPNGS